MGVGRFGVVARGWLCVVMVYVCVDFMRDDDWEVTRPRVTTAQ